MWRLSNEGTSQRPRKRIRGERTNIGDGGSNASTPRPYSQVISEFVEDRSTSAAASHESSISSTGDGGKDSRLHGNSEAPNPQTHIHKLSFILHPSHEISNTNKEHNSSTRKSVGNTQQPSFIRDACSALGVTQSFVDQMIKTYFENMVVISLLHEPTFTEKLMAIGSSAQLNALLAAMLAFAVRFHADENTIIGSTNPSETRYQAANFLSLAFKYIDTAVNECGDQTPPLCVLQACIISAHCQLTQGVLGRAWRSLGTCVRLAYEMNLHLIDMKGAPVSAETDSKRWCYDEEKRRAWWAIWEMDVFATTIRRTPTAVDWSQIETLLPVEDKYWFCNQPRPSCFLDRDITTRWKTLRDSGNQSSKSWFIVINSLMKDAQRISSPRGIPNSSQLSGSLPYKPSRKHDRDSSDMVEEARQVLETISNAVHCFELALPAHLSYRNQYLGFNARDPSQFTSPRHMHCSIHNIYVMTQLAKLMIHRYEVFGSHNKLFRLAEESSNTVEDRRQHQARFTITTSKGDTGMLALRQYFEAANNIVTIVNRSCDDHIRYINPFLSYTIWLGSAVQLVHRIFSPPGTNRNLIKSRFEILHLTYRKCVDFWGIQTAVQQNLEKLEAQVEACLNSERSNQEVLSDRSRHRNHQVGLELDTWQRSIAQRQIDPSGNDTSKYILFYTVF
ncbi:fungal-specific transcription factor domain-containing protein [Xylogone sp. PMI_703]|nr:fungal-specific transcription factor domain-containing protein [Xylogone sp. PMI_703]